MATMNSLMSGGIDYFEICSDELYVPDIDSQFIVVFQDNGVVHHRTFKVYETDSYEKVLKETVEFCQNNNVIVLYEEPTGQYFNPQTGEEVNTPYCGRYCKDYYEQPVQPIHHAGYAIETDDLPF